VAGKEVELLESGHIGGLSGVLLGAAATVGRICIREVHVANGDESVQSAAQRMEARRVGTLVVIDSDQKPIGLVTDRDLAVRVVAPGGIRKPRPWIKSCRPRR
jgi:CBS domain-containing protein